MSNIINMKLKRQIVLALVVMITYCFIDFFSVHVINKDEPLNQLDEFNADKLKSLHYQIETQKRLNSTDPRLSPKFSIELNERLDKDFYGPQKFQLNDERIKLYLKENLEKGSFAPNNSPNFNQGKIDRFKQSFFEYLPSSKEFILASLFNTNLVYRLVMPDEDGSCVACSSYVDSANNILADSLLRYGHLTRTLGNTLGGERSGDINSSFVHLAQSVERLLGVESVRSLALSDVIDSIVVTPNKSFNPDHNKSFNLTVQLCLLMLLLFVFTSRRSLKEQSPSA